LDAPGSPGWCAYCASVIKMGFVVSLIVESQPAVAEATTAVYLEVVSPLEDIVEDLKKLPPDRLEMAASYIRRLQPISLAEREAALARTFGCLSPEEADELERVIEEGCEQVNERAW
jgi:hypothetical protein